MRETLRQLGLTLAFPVAVGVVWMVRAEPAATPVPASATAYRVELADLPLPIPERLRQPGEATRWQGARVIPEESSARNRRAALPIVPAPTPVDLAVEEAPELEIAASSSPHAVVDPSHEAIVAPRSAPLGVAALIAVAPSPGSHRPRSVPTSAASTESETPAQSTPERAEQTQAAKPVTTVPSTLALASAVKEGRLAAVEPAPDFARPNTKPNPSSGPVPQPDYDRILPKLTPIVVGGTEPEKSPHEKFEKTDWPASPTPPGPATHEPFIVSPFPKPFEPSFQPKDPPRLPFIDDAAPEIAVLEPEISSPELPFPWLASRPRMLLTIPEPGSAVLIGVALAALGAARRRRA